MKKARTVLFVLFVLVALLKLVLTGLFDAVL